MQAKISKGADHGGIGPYGRGLAVPLTHGNLEPRSPRGIELVDGITDEQNTTGFAAQGLLDLPVAFG